jgi:hypothetical protein
MSKYQVKVGADFDPTNEVKAEVSVVEVNVTIVVETTPVKDETSKTGVFKDWKVTAVVAIAMLVFSTAAYAAIYGDQSLFDKVIDAVTQVAGHAFGKK